MAQENVAMVGTPCEIMAASKLQSFVETPIDVKIGLFCMENFSYSYLVQFLRDLNIQIGSIEKFRIEKGFAFFFMNDEVKKVHIHEIQKALRKNCNICMELTSETSDISVGSIGSNDGWSTIIIRTDKGEDIINNAVDQGYIEIEDLLESQLSMLNKIAKKKIKTNKKNILKRENIARPVLYQREISDKIFMDQLSVSHFADLKENVIDIGACVLCGACEYVCPDNLIHIYNRKPQKRGKCPDDCHMCFVTCPRMYLPESVRNDNSKPIGDYKKIVTARNLHDYGGQDGGVVTSLLKYLMDNKIVSDALIVDQDEKIPWKPKSILTKEFDQVLKAAGTKYSACPIFKPLQAIPLKKSDQEDN